MAALGPVRIDATVTEADLRAIAGIDAGGFGDPQDRHESEEADLREELARPWSRAWVARDQSEALVGYLLAWHVADELHILNVTTRTDCRRRGVGRALMLAAIAYGGEKQVKHLLLEVRRSNDAAISLYRSLGFFARGLRLRYYPDDEDAVEMVLLLDPNTGSIVAHDDEIRLV
jgi:ribosomal-protein-alanine N-acetyltransferase